jgi:hypothetical protein
MHDPKIEVLIPRAEQFERAEQAKQGEPFSTVTGKRMLLLDDLRPNANVLLGALREILVDDHGVDATIADIRSLGGDFAEPLPTGVHERLAADFDAVIVALAS